MSLLTPQPPPKPVDGPAVWDLVVADVLESRFIPPSSTRDALVVDMRGRDAYGEGLYGTRLRAGDGRDSLVDAYQEALDLVAYLRKALADGKQASGLYALALDMAFELKALLGDSNG